MAPQEAVDWPPSGPEAIMNRGARQIEFVLIKGVAQACSGFLGSDLRRGSRADLLLPPSHASRSRAVESLLREPVEPRRDKSGGEADHNIDQERFDSAIHRWAVGSTEAGVPSMSWLTDRRLRPCDPTGKGDQVRR